MDADNTTIIYSTDYRNAPQALTIVAFRVTSRKVRRKQDDS